MQYSLFGWKMNFGRGNLALFTRSARPPITPPKVSPFGWSLEHAEYIVGACPGRFWAPSAQLWQFEKHFCFVFVLFLSSKYARFHRFPVGQILRHMNTTSIGVPMKAFGT